MPSDFLFPDLCSCEFSPPGLVHISKEQATGIVAAAIPALSQKALEIAPGHGRQVCQLLFAVQPVPAGVLLLLCMPSFWDLDSQLTCLHKENTLSQGAPSRLQVGPLPRTCVGMFGGHLEDAVVHDDACWACISRAGDICTKGILGHTAPVCAAGVISLCPYFLSLVWCSAGL
jgi:hypothetical protein